MSTVSIEEFLGKPEKTVSMEEFLGKSPGITPVKERIEPASIEDGDRAAEMSRLLMAATEPALPTSTAVEPPKTRVQRILDDRDEQEQMAADEGKELSVRAPTPEEQIDEENVRYYQAQIGYSPYGPAGGQTQLPQEQKALEEITPQEVAQAQLELEIGDLVREKGVKGARDYLQETGMLQKEPMVERFFNAVVGKTPGVTEQMLTTGTEAFVSDLAGILTGLVAPSKITQAAGLTTRAAIGARRLGVPGKLAEIGGRAVGTGTTFGLRGVQEIAAQIANDEEVSPEEAAKHIVNFTLFGGGLGAVGAVPQATLRIPAEGLFGYLTAYLQGATPAEAALTGALFMGFGLINRRNLSFELKDAAFGRLLRTTEKKLAGEGIPAEAINKLKQDMYRIWSMKVNPTLDDLIKAQDELAQVVRIKPSKPGEVAPKKPAEVGVQAPKEGIKPEIRPEVPVKVPPQEVKAVPEVPGAAKVAKEPWEMTRAEFISIESEYWKKTEKPERVYKATLGASHYKSVEKALSEGKPVPAAILAEYPELAKEPAGGGTSTTGKAVEAPEGIITKPEGAEGIIRVAEGIKPQQISLAKIKVNKDLFQPRERLDPAMVDKIAEEFDPALWEPPVLWADPADGQLYIVSGHTRFAAIQKSHYDLGTFKSLPMGTTLEDARRLAEAGNLARVEQNDWENAGVVRRRVDQGESLAQIRKDLPGLGGQEKVANLQRLSYLNQKGLFKENWGNTSFPRVTSYGFFVGQMRQRFPWLTDRHEQDVFDYLYKQGAAHHPDSAVPKETILHNLEVLDLTEKKPSRIELKHKLLTGLDARKDTAEISQELKEKRRDMKRLTEVLTNNDITDEGRRQIKSEIAIIEGEIALIERGLGIITKTQTGLFESKVGGPRPVFNLFTGKAEGSLTEAESAAVAEQSEIRRQYEREQDYIRKQVANGKMPETEATKKRAHARNRYTRKLEQMGQKTLFGGGVSDVEQGILFRKDAPRMVQTFGTGGLHDMPLEPALKQKKPIKASRIIRKIEHGLKVPIRGRATHRSRRAGFYIEHDRLIRVMTANDISTVAHEIGHHIERLIWGKGADLSVKGRVHFKRFQKELADLDYDQSERRTLEGFAEYLRHYLTGTDDAVRLAPKFHKYFTEEVLPRQPKIKAVLDEAVNDIRLYREQGSEARVLSQIDFADGAVGAVKEFLSDPVEHFDRAITKVRTALEDDLLPVQKAMERAGIKRKGLRPSRDPVELARSLKEKAPGMARQFVLDGTFDQAMNKTGPGLKEILQPVRKNIRQFLAYAYSRRAIDLYTNPERARRAHERGEIPKSINPGISFEDAKHVFRKYDNPTFRRASDGLTQWSDYLLQYLVQAGGMSPEAAEGMRVINPVYLALKRSFNKDVIGRRGAGGRGYTDQPTVVKRIVGSGREIVDPLESMVEYANNIISVANKIQVARAVAQLAEKHPGIGNMIVKVPAPQTATRVSASDMMDALIEMGYDVEGQQGEPVLDEFMTVFENSTFYKGKDRIVALWMNGERQFYEIVDPDLWNALTGMDAVVLHPFFEWVFAKPTRMGRLGATGLNPAFSLVRNLIRDVMLFAVTTKHGKFGPFSALAGTGKDIADSVGLLDIEAVKKFKRGGGEMTTWVGQDRKLTKKLSHEIVGGKVVYTAAHPVEALRALFQIPEIGSRIAEYEKAYEEGERQFGEGTQDAHIYAMNQAQEVTTNFSRKGTIGRILNQMLMFWNAAVQGPAMVYRVFKDRPVRATLQLLVWIGSTTMGLWLLNKDKKFYKERTAYERANWWYIISDDEEVVIKIPKPFEVGTLSAVIEAYLDSEYNSDDTLFKDVIDAAGDILIPPHALRDVQAIGPVLDVMVNKDFAGRTIVREDLKRKKPEDQYNEYTYKVFKWLGQKLGVSPLKMQYVANAYSGGVIGRLARFTENVVTKLAGEDEKLTAADIPVIGTLFVRTIKKPARTIERFYNELTELRTKKASDDVTPDEARRLRFLERRSDKMSDLWKQLRSADSKDRIEGVYKKMVKALSGVYGNG